MSTGQTRYWCHVCNAEVNIYMAPEPTCQQCNEQFIEEVKTTKKSLCPSVIPTYALGLSSFLVTI